MNWDERFLDLARHIATWSKDPSTKVGAVVIGDRRIVRSVGYNGFPRGIEDTEERLNDRPTKYLLVAHAERNALDNADCSLAGGTMYVTLCPCSECAKSIIQRGIARVVAPTPDLQHERWGEAFRQTLAMFEEAGVQFSGIKP